MSRSALPALPWNNVRLSRGMLFGLMIFGALLAFEVFNFSTTDFALRDMLGDLRFLGLRWSTILAVAFCGIDFAGIARIFTPEQGADEPAEVWYLFGAWLLAAAMNASLTWWGVSVAISSHTSAGASILGAETIQKVVPVFVAVMIWLIRLLIIGTISIAGDRLFSQETASRARRAAARRTPNRSRPATAARPLAARPTPAAPSAGRSYAARPSAPRRTPSPSPEPQYVDEPYSHSF